MRRVLALVAASALLAASAGHSSSLAYPAHPAHHAPVSQLTLWAWERPEDLRFLDDAPGTRHEAPGTAPGTGHPAPGTVAVRVAYLDRTIRFDAGRMTIRYRQQPLLVAPDTPLMSVVRVETRGRAPDVSKADTAAALVVDALHAPRVRALQIDFDARRSDRPFYAALIKSVRSKLPRGIPLSITALASWCMDDPWIDTRDVDEIVPMLFQMGPDARHVLTELDENGRWPVASCNGAAGLATDERHDRLPPARSVYVFNPRAWTPGDLRALPGN